MKKRNRIDSLERQLLSAFEQIADLKQQLEEERRRINAINLRDAMPIRRVEPRKPDYPGYGEPFRTTCCTYVVPPSDEVLVMA